ncbi:MAG: right-handed parallel beta-helix repeat-containing protein [Anaerolineales bacterium]|nr:right-handed parallel beta-helix repeat-containing protein [Anaerolineales bacterium]
MKKHSIPRSVFILALGLILACAPLDTIREILESGSVPVIDRGGLDPLPPLEGTELPSGPTLYVALSGNDDNDCLTAAAACRTIPGAIEKAEWRSEIRISPGAYDGSFTIPKDLILAGQPSSTARIVKPASPSPTAPNVIVAENIRAELFNLQIEGLSAPLERSTAHGLMINSGGTALLAGVSIRGNRGTAVYNLGTLYFNGGSVTGNDTGIFNSGTADIRGVDIRNNTGGTFGTYGFLNRGDAALTDVVLRDNAGTGVEQSAGSLVLSAGSVGGNQWDGFLLEAGNAEINGTVFDANHETGVAIRSGSASLNAVRIERNARGLTVAGGDVEAEDSSVRNHPNPGIEVSAGGLALRDVEVTGNRNGLVVRGSGNAAVNGAVFESNAGDGVYLEGGRLTMNNSRVTGNRAGMTIDSGTATAQRVAVNGNTSYGVLLREGSLRLMDAQILDNGDFGFWQYGDPADSLLPETIFERVAIARNRNDGINLQEGSLEATNLTVSSNAANGITAASTAVSLSFSTVVFNEGQAGIYAGGGARMTSANNIVVSNRSVLGDCYTHPTGEFNHLGFDLACRPDLDSTSLRLGPLTEIGGTFVHPLMAGSPAMDAAVGACPAEDQRGVARPAGDGCDVGAYEYDPLASATPSSGTATGTLIVTANCRIGPGTAYDIFTVLQEGSVVNLEGRNDRMPRWWWILVPAGAAHCWLSDEVLAVEGSAADLPVVEAPPLPAPEPFQPNA